MRDARAKMALVSFGLVLALAVVGVEAQEGQQFNPQVGFQFGDIDVDGRLSREEFLVVAARGPRLQGKPKLAEQLFERLDVDANGYLTFEEFARIRALRPGGGGGMGPNAKAKAAVKRPRTARPQTVASAKSTPEQVAFFESKIRPVLANQCYKCHSAKSDKIKGGLVLDTREGIRKGGDTGPAVVPGDVEESLIIQAIRQSDDSFKMPPKDKLSDAVIADFEHWVKMGAPDPRDSGKAPVAAKGIDVEKGRQFWAFQPPKAAPAPAVKDESWPRSEIDRFLLAKLEEKGLAPVGDAEKHALLRRVYFDLVGLPPTPEEIEAFVGDPSPTAFEKVVDQLLASPRFGERWGRHWLDVARFGETSGKQVNFNYPFAWRYRDYVIAALNADKPYDRFLKEQIAGDLLPAATAKQRAEQTIATSFLAIGPKPHIERNPAQFQMDMVDEQIDATSQAFLGLTVACARCHDHKFDPIPQQDYYALAGVFMSTETCYGTVRLIQNTNPSPLLTLPKDSGQPAGLEPLPPSSRKELQAQIDQVSKNRFALQKEGKLFATKQGIVSGIRLAMMRARLALYEEDGTPKRLAMGVRERPRPSDSPLYQRGEVDKPGELVPRGVVKVVSRKVPHVDHGSGRRELADWLSARDNPLTARVMVNRVWLHLFGRGLVPTPDNFGAAGQPPSHPELLDYLALSFMDQKWSVKTLIRQVVLSRAYQLDTRFDAKNQEADPDDVLVWRMSPRRLEGEALRDAMLVVSGNLETDPPKISPVARAGEGNSNPLMRFGTFDMRLSCRSVYLPVIRNHFLESLALFDFPDPGMIVAERATTTVPAQGLYLLNNPFVLRQAESAAEHLLAVDGDTARIRRAYLQVFGRPPTAKEQSAAAAFINAYSPTAGTSSASAPPTPKAAWTAFCQALFASADFLYRG